MGLAQILAFRPGKEKRGLLHFNFNSKVEAMGRSDALVIGLVYQHNESKLKDPVDSK